MIACRRQSVRPRELHYKNRAERIDMHRDNRNHPLRNTEWHEPLYGRRVETDRSWTVYHVFTGIPADASCGVMTGLSRVEATNRMMSLNRHSEVRRRPRSPCLPCTSTQTA